MSLKGPTDFSSAKTIEDIEVIYQKRYGKDNLQLFKKIIEIDNQGQAAEADRIIAGLSSELQNEFKCYARDTDASNAKIDEISTTQKAALTHKFEAEKSKLAKKLQQVDKNIDGLTNKKEKMLTDQISGVKRKNGPGKGCNIL